ncbi:MAG: hypothetical protein CM15mV59_0290 [Caudoviricetes sp.]|nr:MAG: hypothetical protein CM15mV59_0290 [Caudoviricetes sp.]
MEFDNPELQNHLADLISLGLIPVTEPVDKAERPASAPLDPVLFVGDPSLKYFFMNLSMSIKCLLTGMNSHDLPQLY